MIRTKREKHNIAAMQMHKAESVIMFLPVCARLCRRGAWDYFPARLYILRLCDTYSRIPVPLLSAWNGTMPNEIERIKCAVISSLF